MFQKKPVITSTLVDREDCKMPKVNTNAKLSRSPNLGAILKTTSVGRSTVANPVPKSRRSANTDLSGPRVTEPMRSAKPKNEIGESVANGESKGQCKKEIIAKPWEEDKKTTAKSLVRLESVANPASTLAPFKDPVNVVQPGWRSSQVSQGSGVFGDGGAKAGDTVANNLEIIEYEMIIDNEGEDEQNEMMEEPMFEEEEIEAEMILSMIKAESDQRKEEMMELARKKIEIEKEEKKMRIEIQNIRKRDDRIREAAAKTKAAREGWEEWLEQALEFERNNQPENTVHAQTAVQVQPQGGVITVHTQPAVQAQPQGDENTVHAQTAVQVQPQCGMNNAHTQPAAQAQPQCDGNTAHTQPAAQAQPRCDGNTVHTQQADQAQPQCDGNTVHTQPAVQAQAQPQGGVNTAYTQPAAQAQPQCDGNTAHTQHAVQAQPQSQGGVNTAHTQHAAQAQPQWGEYTVHTQPAGLPQWVEYDGHTQPAVCPSGMEDTTSSLGPAAVVGPSTSGPSAVGPSPSTAPTRSPPSSSRTREVPKKRKMSLEEKRREARQLRMSSSRALDITTNSDQQEPQNPAPSMVRSRASLFQTEDT